MSNTNYDVEKTIPYDSGDYRHYIPYFQVVFPYWQYKTAKATRDSHGDIKYIKTPEDLLDVHPWKYCASYSIEKYDAFISFDTGNEEQVTYTWYQISDTSINAAYNKHHTGELFIDVPNQSGIFSKVYYRNPHRKSTLTPFLADNTLIRCLYSNVAYYEVTLNSSGYLPASNQQFICSTVKKNCKVQYPNLEPVIFYKKSTDSSYTQYNNATVSGTWSNTKVNANLPIQAGYTYNIYIHFRTDQVSGLHYLQADTNVANFSLTDGTPTTQCVSPNGTYTNGTINFIWSHATEYGTAQYAYDLQYSANNGSSWTTVANHVVSSVNNRTVTISTSGVYLWRVRTYNVLNEAGSWAQASFINNVPAATPKNLVITTKGRPTLSWNSTAQVAYQVQMLSNDQIVYDSGAVYSGQNSHFVNMYFDDDQAYNGRVRIYNNIGNVSAWVTSGYQQPEVTDVVFTLEQYEQGGAVVNIAHNEVFSKYYIKRNGVLIGEATNDKFIDKFAVGTTNYAVIGVTTEDQSDIKEKGIEVVYPRATITTLGGAQYAVNKRVNTALEIVVNNEADVNTAKFIGDSTPTHYFNGMQVKTFQISFFDENDVAVGLIGSVVFYADNFGNGGYCVLTSCEKTESFVQNSFGTYANEVVATLEATNYDDSIEYQL